MHPIDLSTLKSADIQSAIHQQLDKITCSEIFLNAPRMCDLLRYVVQEEIGGRSDRLKQFTIAVEVFGRDQSFDAQSDPIVRVQMGRLRRALATYYLTLGKDDTVIFDIPKGSYAIRFLSADTDEEKEQVGVALQADQFGQVPKVGVLPFTCNASDPELVSLCGGLSDEISLELSRFDNLNVAASMEQDEGSLQDRLDETFFIVSGSIRQLGERVRVHARLQRSDTRQQIWAERYDFVYREHDLFSMLDEVISSVVGEIASTFGVIHRYLYKLHITNENALCQPNYYQASLKYRHYLMALTKETFNSALLCAQKAHQNEPEHAGIWTILAVLHLDAYTLGIADIPNARETAIQYANKAIEMEPNRQGTAMMQALLYQAEADTAGVINSAEHVVELNPNNAYMVGLAGQLLCLAGKFERGMELMTESMRLNAYQPAWFNLAHYLYYFKRGEFEVALKQLDQFSHTELFWSPLLRAAALQRQGLVQEAKLAYQQVLNLCPDFEQTAEQRITSYVVAPELAEMLFIALKEIRNS
ncbi:hypothetical protein L4D76_15330 [Photobacterium sagamiensis]|uniref:hypothetical protein n=1 Tax=Photobacterium sagamiensis TaxID=2910241 RepID=UPI003D152595